MLSESSAQQTTTYSEQKNGCSGDEATDGTVQFQRAVIR